MADPLTPGTRFGEFEILDRAGEGGMGVVYRARQASLGRTVALKVISPSVVDAEDFRIRFGHESRLAASIDHPNVVSVYDAGEVDGQPYIAMQWVDGADLQTLLSRGPLEPGRAATIIVQIARALDAAHAKGLLHRDVKPGNVLVRQLPDGDHAYLTDFGLAKLQDSEAMTQLTKTGYYIGTTGYLSPEQIRGEDVTPVSDLYALGCVLHEALTGSQPFARTNDMAVAWAHANDPRPRPSELRPELGAGWDEVVAKAMAIEPGERYATGAALAAAVYAAAGERPVPAEGAAAPQTRPAAAPTVAAAAEPPAPAPQTPALPLRRDDPAPPPPPPVVEPTHATGGNGSGGGGRSNLAILAVLGVIATAGAAVGVIAATGGFPSGGSATPANTGGETLVTGGNLATARKGGGTAAGQRSADIRTILEVLHVYEAAYSSHSLSALSSLFSPNVFRHGLRAGGCSDVTGRDAVLKTYAEQFTAGTGTYQLFGLRPGAVRLSNNHAQINAGYRITPGGTGSILFSLVKAGTWKIDRIVASCG